MAQKRMFDRAIIDTDKFMDLPMTAKAMYFLLGLEADDEGFVSHKKVQRVHGGSEDDVRVLALKGFVIMFESGVVVITDWRKNNWLDKRRIRATEYTTEKGMLSVNENKEYVLSNGLADAEQEPAKSKKTQRLALAKPEERSIEEYRREERSRDITSARADLQTSSSPKPFDIFWAAYPKKEMKVKAEQVWARKKLDNHLESILFFIGKAKQTSRWSKGFVKQPTRFLSDESWNDDLAAYADRYAGKSKGFAMV